MVCGNHSNKLSPIRHLNRNWNQYWNDPRRLAWQAAPQRTLSIFIRFRLRCAPGSDAFATIGTCCRAPFIYLKFTEVNGTDWRIWKEMLSFHSDYLLRSSHIDYSLLFILFSKTTQQMNLVNLAIVSWTIQVTILVIGFVLTVIVALASGWFSVVILAINPLLFNR